MKRFVLSFALIVGLLTSASTLQAQVNTSRYITLTVTNGAAIKLNFKAAADGTPVRIVSGSNTRNITVGTDWYDNHSPSTFTVTADASTMTVYGDIIGFDCSKNGVNLTVLDPSHNTQLTELWCSNNTLNSLDVSGCTQLTKLYCNNNTLNSLDVSGCTQLTRLYCHGNNFSTATLDDIYCALPDRTGKSYGKIQPIFNSSSSNYATVLATNKQNATAKNWKVQYYYDDTDIPATTGSYVCPAPEPNMNRYITLTVTNGAAIKLDFKAAAAGTPVRIVSGSNTQNITVGTNWKGIATYTAGSTTMTIYGDIIMFDCSKNGVNLTVLDPSHNTQLMKLWCYNNTLNSLNVSGCTQLTTLECFNNTLTSLDVSNNTQLTMLNCSNNPLNSLDVSQNTQLKYLNCSENQLTTLDVSGCTQLDELYCFDNTLNSLDVSGCTQLTTLWCYDNPLNSLNLSNNTQLTVLNCHNNPLNSLDVSQNTQLTRLYCHGNNFSTAALDDIFCALPDRTGKESGVIQPVYSDTSSNHAIVLATNKANAIAKNWKVQYYKNNADIPATTGSYVCPQLNMDSYITITVAKDSAIKLDFMAAAATTPIRIVSGSTTQDFIVGTDWTGTASYTAGSTTMTIYGDLIGFDCSENGVNLTALDLSHNTQLTGLWCGENNLTSLDVRKNSQLKKLTCYNNKLSSLDVSKNTQLEKLYCWSNSFTTAALDDIYCALPDRTGKTNGNILPIYNSSSSDHATVIATNAQNATSKNWKVQYADNTDIPTTTGTYVCGTPHTDIAEASAEQALTLYPNPVADVLYLSATARTIRIYNIYGTEVAHATDTDRIDVAHLPAGVYTVKADGTVAKMVKR